MRSPWTVSLGRSVLDEEREARAAQFVGREDELAAFSKMLSSRSTSRILLVHGLGGIGKTALLRAFASEARSKRIQCHFVDARDHVLGEGADAVLRLLDKVFVKRAKGAITTILIDTAEVLADVESALCEQVLRRARPTDRIVIAGRMRPSAAWRQLSLWGGAVKELPLEGLSREESAKLLSFRGVSPKAQKAVLAFAHGHPLALLLASDRGMQSRATTMKALAPPEVVAALSRTMVTRIDREEHRTALEVSVIARVTTEPLLASVLGEKARESFQWLRALSFMESHADGVSPHSLAREVIEADLQWTNPGRYRELLVAIFRHAGARLSMAAARDVEREMIEFGFLTRKVPGLAGAFEVPMGLGLTRDRATPHDIEEMKKWVMRHESKEAAVAFEHWYAVQPGAFHVLRKQSGEPAVVACILALHRTTEAERRKDRGVSRTWAHAVSLLGKATRDTVLMVRFLVEKDNHQSPSATLAAIAAVVAEPLVRLKTLPLYYHYYANWPEWKVAIALAGARAAPEAGFTVGGKSYVVSFHDRRGALAGTWAAEVAERMLAHGDGVEANRVAADVRPGLDAKAWNREVRAALKKMHDIAWLEKSPLAASHLASSRGGANRGERLQRVLVEGTQMLKGTSRDDSLYRAVQLCFVEPASSQHAAGKTMGVAYGTYRRHLAAGIERMIAVLWVREQAARD